MKEKLTVISSGAIRLRRLTLKSVLGFGKYQHLAVLEIMNLKDHKYLLWVYYNCSNIDFNEETKEYLRITLEREIEKPGKDGEMFGKFHGKALFEIIERDKEYDESNPDRFFTKHNNAATRKAKIVSNCIRQNKEKSKLHNRNRNQKH